MASIGSLTKITPLTVLTFLLWAGCDASQDGGPPDGAIVTEGCSGIAGENVRLIVPFSPGGGYDVYARLLEPHLEEALGVEVRVENRVGAGGRVGARTVHDAAPDGRTLGILNATSLLVSELSEDLSGLHPFEDFTPLGRIGMPEPVWATGPSSGFENVEEMLEASVEDPILLGITDVGSTGFVSVSVSAELLGMNLVHLAGYSGSREVSLGLIRGDFDLGGFTFESILDRVETGDIEPVLQVSARPVSAHPALRGVPVLAGPDGLAARTARERGEDPSRAAAQAQAVVGLFEAGRLLVAPPGLPPALAACLTGHLAAVAQDSAFLSAASRARRSVAYEDPAALRDMLLTTADDRRGLTPILRRHIDLARGGSDF